MPDMAVSRTSYTNAMVSVSLSRQSDQESPAVGIGGTHDGHDR